VTATWTKTETGMKIWLRPLVPVGVRIFGAVMLSPLAVALGWALVSSVGELRESDGIAAALGIVPGLLLVLVAFVLAALPSWALLFARRGLLLEQARHRILVVHDFRLFRWRRTYPVDRIDEIAVLREFVRTRTSHRSSGPGSATVFVVRLVLGPDNRRIVVARQPTFQDARVIAAGIAEPLGKNFLEV
jgi:hypothetical protein